MSEHSIRLRGAWQWETRADGLENDRRVDLPTRWPKCVEGPIRLARRFGRPRIDPRSERVRLELRDVPGLVTARLNGFEVVQAGGDASAWVVELIEPLPARNELVLDLVLGPFASPSRAAPWGDIALVIAGKIEAQG